jgi:predicted DNA-binding protein
MVGIRLPPEVTEKLDAWAEEQGVTRSEAVRRAIYAALKLD